MRNKSAACRRRDRLWMTQFIDCKKMEQLDLKKKNKTRLHAKRQKNRIKEKNTKKYLEGNHAKFENYTEQLESYIKEFIARVVQLYLLKPSIYFVCSAVLPLSEKNKCGLPSRRWNSLSVNVR